MCEEVKEASKNAKNNIDILVKKIDALQVPDKFKAKFISTSDYRGFRVDDDTLEQMEAIGMTKSETCLELLNGKANGLIVAYLFATEMDTEKERATLIQDLEEKGKKPTKDNVVKFILAIKNRLLAEKRLEVMAG